MVETSLEKIADDICSDCIFKHMSLVDRHVTSVFSKALSGLGVTPNQLCFLVVILKISAIADATPSLFGKILGMEKSTVSRNLKRMATRGLVEFKTTNRGYASEVSITDAGKEAVTAAYESWSKAQETLKESLGEDIVQGLKQFAGQLSPPPQPPAS